ncbi:hypothetical protein DCS32_11665 [Dokdonia sp. Dokd-P16]|uniref:hypothetical protein n=1 Tax=Dokdonia sp. Dokd-P16 TaxID=2173169 RepID=UPI000D549754|nr:hypothetical protein [Dokdonia sp. Dokd-P16]AWH74790.1 hypothetical protein DCS32_11665 [Dokdonia sp. Dokd-P16]
MLKIFKHNKSSDYKKRLLKAFPKKLENDVKEVLEIIPFDNNEIKRHDGTRNRAINLIHESELDIKLENETLTIPYRLYFNEPTPGLENTLTEKQKDILNCIFLRHHNGYLREKRLNLLSDSSEKWIIPFIVQLIGEYIYELLPIIDKKVNKNTLSFYAEFIDVNQKYWQQTESRMISYWNEYYRYKFPILKDYLGFKITTRIKKQRTTKN